MRNLGKIAYRIISPAMLYLPIFRRPRTRVAVILNNREILLVKNWLGYQRWTLPGGGMKRNETPAEAAVRELKEETGLLLDPHDLTFLGHMTNPEPPRAVIGFRVDLTDADSAVAIPNHARYEIIDLAWHPLESLPEDRGPIVDQALARQ